jgi:gluconolactonase
MTRPNGLAFSPDEKYLYIANSDEAKKVWMRYEVKDDGTIANGQVFFDVTAEKEPGLPDGMKVDKAGNLYCTGPGGVWIISAAGKHLGTIKPPETPANVHWGKLADVSRSASLGANEDANTLYMTAQTGVYRIALTTAGIRP